MVLQLFFTWGNLEIGLTTSQLTCMSLCGVVRCPVLCTSFVAPWAWAVFFFLCTNACMHAVCIYSCVVFEHVHYSCLQQHILAECTSNDVC